MQKIFSSLLTDKEKKAIQETVSQLHSNYPIKTILLYGSKAKGNSTAESDMDLLVLTGRKLNWKERNSMTDAIYDIQLKYDVVISLLVVPEDEWKSGKYSVLAIHDEIEKYGVAA